METTLLPSMPFETESTGPGDEQTGPEPDTDVTEPVIEPTESDTAAQGDISPPPEDADGTTPAEPADAGGGP